jgi:hypothetical protein
MLSCTSELPPAMRKPLLSNIFLVVASSAFENPVPYQPVPWAPMRATVMSRPSLSRRVDKCLKVDVANVAAPREGWSATRRRCGIRPASQRRPTPVRTRLRGQPGVRLILSFDGLLDVLVVGDLRATLRSSCLALSTPLVSSDQESIYSAKIFGFRSFQGISSSSSAASCIRVCSSP